MIAASHPILSCAEAAEFEAEYFKSDEAAQWIAMRRAGVAVAAGVLNDCREIGGFRDGGNILVLVGKGHNGGDALIAAGEILARFPAATADIAFAFGPRTLKPLAKRAYQEFLDSAPDRIRVVRPQKGGSGIDRYDVSLDGVFGFSFRPPVEARVASFLDWANSQVVRLRAAVDLPSGVSDLHAFRADFTYATGIVKSPLLACENAGRLRYLDLGFFDKDPGAGESRVLTAAVLERLARLRPAHTDKRERGHVMVVGGALQFPGAILMSVLSALRSGAGLVTAFVPESLIPAYAARAPEAMWVGMPTGKSGGLAPEGLSLLSEKWEKAAAIVMGSGMGRGPETHALLLDIVKAAPVPIVVDADALQPDIVRSIKVPHILTPHMGEFARIAGGSDLKSFCLKTGSTVILKGPVSCIASAASPSYYSFFGGPVLARGGSGDILAGLVGGLLAQTPSDPIVAACTAAVWHGKAADCLARAKGQTAVSVTQLLDYLSEALRE